MVAEGVSIPVQDITVVSLFETRKELTEIISKDDTAYCVVVFSEELYRSNLIQTYVASEAVVVYKKNMDVFQKDRKSTDLYVKALLPHKGIHVKYILMLPGFIDVYEMTDTFFDISVDEDGDDYGISSQYLKNIKKSDLGVVAVIDFENVQIREVEYKVVEHNNDKLLHVIGGLLYKRDYSTVAVISDTTNYSNILKTTLFAEAHDLRIINLDGHIPLNELCVTKQHERLLIIGTPDTYFKYGHL
jgi:hypothetical protein